jgi:hypothetical protein
MGAGRRYAPDNNDLTSPWRNPSPRPLFVQPHFFHLHRPAWPNFATKTEPPCTAMRRFEPARTPYPHRPMIPTSSPRPGRGCAEDLLKRRNTRVAVAFRHGRNLGRMIGHAQRPRYVAIVLFSFFFTPIVSTLPPRYFGRPRHSLLTSPHPLLPPSTHPPFKLFLCIPSLSCRHDPYIHFCNTTSTNATQCHVPATFFCTSPPFNLFYTHACHWLAHPLTSH